MLVLMCDPRDYMAERYRSFNSLWGNELSVGPSDLCIFGGHGDIALADYAGILPLLRSFPVGEGKEISPKECVTYFEIRTLLECGGHHRFEGLPPWQ